MISNLKGIYFDLDDTLCAYWDACKIGLPLAIEETVVPGLDPKIVFSEWAIAFREFCSTLKSTEHYEAYLKNGETTRTELMRRTLKRLNVEDERLAKRMSAAYLRYRHANLNLFPDAAQVLKSLGHEFQLGVMTNGPADVQREELNLLGLRETFQHFFIEGELGFGKPNPRVFQLANDAMQCKPEEILFVGNSYEHDIRPAIEAGFRTAWVRRPSDVPISALSSNPRPEERPADAPVPDLEIEHLSELLPVLLPAVSQKN